MVLLYAQCKVRTPFNDFKEDLINFAVIIMHMKKRKINWSVIILALFVTGLTSCGTERTREEKVAAMINSIESPFFVMNSSPGNLIEKSGAADGALPYTQEMVLGFFIEEEITGVDYDLDVQVIVGRGGGFTPNFYGIFKLKDEVVFKELLETETGAEIKEKDGYQYVMKEGDSYVIVWNEEFAVATSIPMDISSMFSGGSKEGMKTVDKTIALIESGDEGEINEMYKTFLENDADISMRFEGKPFYGYLEDVSMGMSDELEEQREMVEEINSDLFVNFTNGSVDLKWVGNLSERLKEEFGFLADGPVDKRLLDFGNSKNPMFTMVYNLDLNKGLDYTKEQMSEYDYEDFEEELSKMGVNVDLAKAGLTGDILFVVDRVEMRTEIIDWGYGEPYESNESTPIFGAVLGIGDIAALSSLVAASDSLGTDGILKQGDAYLVIFDDILFSTNDSLWAVKVKNGGGVTIEDKGDVLTKKPFGMYLDFAKLVGMDDLDGVELAADKLESLKGEGDINEMNISLIMNDKTRNALRIITEAVAGFAEGGQGSGEEFEQLRNELDEAAAETAETEVREE
ncbi:MAG: hypothetical protein ACI8ZM_001510 [Crocinitomix sp.]|jgi:hypothetical protein